MSPRVLIAVIGILVLLACSSMGHAQWNRFRGPNGSGVADDSSATPTRWSEATNLKWKLELPGSGVSSPIVVGDQVFVTTYSGYGESREEIGNMDDLKRHLVCVDKETGEIAWHKTVPSTVKEDPYTGMGVPQHGYASHTPTSDGKNVYVFFGKTGVLAFDLQGQKLWQTSVGTDSDHRYWGSSSSPIVYEDVLVVPAGAESRAIVGLDKNTGKELWRAEADGLGSVWGTPAVVRSKTSTDIVIGAPYEIWAINPNNGRLRWYCEAMETDSFSSSIVVDGEVIYAIEGRGGGSIAVRAGGKDDITKTNVIWTGRDNARFGSPVVYQGRLYYVSNKIATCIDAKTGETIFEGRLRGEAPTTQPVRNQGRRGRGGFGSTDYSSPVIADGKLYFVTRGGETFVLEAKTEFKQLAVNRVTPDAEEFSATPAISAGAIYLRSNKHLYCVAE